MAADDKIAVLGAGAFGTALARLLSVNGNTVHLWTRNRTQLQNIRRSAENTQYLPGISIPREILLTSELRVAVTGVDWILIAVPSSGFVPLVDQLSGLCADAARGIAWATKGFEPGRSRLLHEVVIDRFREDWPVAILSGPSFALEIATGQPTAITVASPDGRFAGQIAAALHNAVFRAYTSTDLIGVEVGGAVKNVMAIAAGISDGLGFGANTRAALVTRALAEITRLGVALGAQPSTFLGLAGVGDLMLSCNDDKSRNRRFGLALGTGASVEQAQAKVGALVEGIHNTAEVLRLAARADVEMPIAEQVFNVLFKQLSPQTAVSSLLLREPRSEVC